MLNIKEIIEKIKSNKNIIYIVIGITIIIIAFIISMITRAVEKQEVALIEQPLSFYKNFQINVSTELANQVVYDKKGMEIYIPKIENRNIWFEGVLTSLNISTTKKSAIGSYMYVWETKQKDTITYDSVNQSIYISLIDPIDIDIKSVTESDIKNYLTIFINKYFSSEYSYYDTKIEKFGTGYKVYFRRDIGGYPLSYPGMNKYFEYIVLDKNLRMKEIKLSVLNFEKGDFNKIKVVLPTNLSYASSSSKYPKNVYYGSIAEIQSDAKVEYDSYITQYIFSKNITSSSVEMVYYFANINQQFITPVYRIEGSGTVSYNKKDYTIPMVVLANAIDPDKVYIPTVIKYAN